ncbi:unnamed protein product, partial [Rotaria sordida]
MPDNYRNDNVVLTSAIHMLTKFGDIQSAERVFHSIKEKNIITYGAMIKGYIGNEMSERALDLFEQIHLNQLGNDRAMKIGKKLLHEMHDNYRNDN